MLDIGDFPIPLCQRLAAGRRRAFGDIVKLRPAGTFGDHQIAIQFPHRTDRGRGHRHDRLDGLMHAQGRDVRRRIDLVLIDLAVTALRPLIEHLVLIPVQIGITRPQQGIGRHIQYLGRDGAFQRSANIDHHRHDLRHELGAGGRVDIVIMARELAARRIGLDAMPDIGIVAIHAVGQDLFRIRRPFDTDRHGRGFGLGRHHIGEHRIVHAVALVITAIGSDGCFLAGGDLNHGQVVALVDDLVAAIGRHHAFIDRRGWRRGGDRVGGHVVDQLAAA